MNGRWDVSGPTVIEVGDAADPVREVRVHLVAGRVDVVAAPQEPDEQGRATVAVSSVRGRGLLVTCTDGVLDVRHPDVPWARLLQQATGGEPMGALEKLAGALRLEDAATVSIAVPEDVTVRLGAVSADALVSGTTRPVEVRTVNGSIAVDDVRADLRARTVSGTVEVTGQDGAVTADSVSGSVTVQARHLPSFAGTSVSGSLTVDLAAAPSDLSVRTVSGDVTVRFPAEAGFRLQARSVSGAVVGDGERLPSRPGAVEGRLGAGGDVTVVARTVSGDVTLLRAQPAPHGADRAAADVPS